MRDGREAAAAPLPLALVFSLMTVSPAAPAVASAASPSPSRIVVLAPSLGEVLSDILGEPEAREKIVGVVSGTDRPAWLESKPRVGGFDRFDVEAIVKLRPDLALATEDGNPAEPVVRLRKIGIPVVTVRTGSVTEIEESLQAVADAVGRGARGVEIRGRFRERLKALSNAKPRLARPRVALQLGADPLVVAGGRGYLSEALEWVGAENVFNDLRDQAYPHPSLEEILRRKPDVVVIAEMGIPTEAEARWRALGIRVVRRLRGDELLRPTARWPEGVRALAEAVSPEGAGGGSSAEAGGDGGRKR